MKYRSIGIIGNGEKENSGFYGYNNDYLIAVNGGSKNCYNSGITPDIIIGDIDSLPLKILNYFIKKRIRIIPFSKDKDKTDTEIAIDEALRLKPEEINFICMSGKRPDHALANIFLMEKIVIHGIRARILSKKYTIELVNKHIQIKGKKGDIVSMLSLSEKSTGITLKGFKYNLINSKLERRKSLGISNVMEKQKAEIIVKKGFILVIHIKSK
ncbi:MAG: thiamine diphosphokinase [Candidatus Firestonebacteria bacterium]|nr:thiamine diphosphokinase [Candidatus Firestonebacteria bacterium]